MVNMKGGSRVCLDKALGKEKQERMTTVGREGGILPALPSVAEPPPLLVLRISRPEKEPQVSARRPPEMEYALIEVKPAMSEAVSHILGAAAGVHRGLEFDTRTNRRHEPTKSARLADDGEGVESVRRFVKVQ